MVDEKGRVAIPTRFTKALSRLQDELLFVTKFKRRERPCLDVYPESAWLKLVSKIAERRRFDRKIAAFESWYVGAAQDVQIDAQHRLLIPPLLREYAGLGRDVVLTGTTDKFRIWSKDHHQQVDREDELEVFQDPSFLDELEL
jgi:MraZ protein